jgi:hypothetical protein
MKQLLLFVTLIFFSFLSYSQNHLTVNGMVEGKTAGKVYLSIFNGGKPLKTDSTSMSGGSFSFNLTMAPFSVFVVTLENSHTPIFLFPDTQQMDVQIKINPTNGNVENFITSGGRLQSAYNAFLQAYGKQSTEHRKLADSFQKARTDKNAMAMKSQNTLMLEKEKAMSDLEQKMIDDNVDNILSLYFLSIRYQKKDLQSLKAKLAKIDSRLQSSELYRHLSK